MSIDVPAKDIFHVYSEVFEEEIGQMLLEQGLIKLIVFDPKTEVILRWIS